MDNALWLDVDGVLLDWQRPFLKHSGRVETYDDMTDYDNSLLFGGVDCREVMLNAMEKFHNSDDFSNLPALIDSRGLERLRVKGYSLRIITQLSGEGPRQRRMTNLMKHFDLSLFDSFVFTDPGTKKAEVLRRIDPYNTGIRVVEDNPQFFIDAELVGGFKPMAIEHPYNRLALKGLRGFPIYRDMREVVRHLCS